ncbi:hypothetical protein CVT25_006782 [Psilocybe cyanescens]|uniref:Uncharacterized protein n=1 Tax=Psilocybe cyanescens TaxID=93625 RepID=A0A409X451_PSICY|nr:hypothetical protein CVT25_006782 [Psilocybe cyanescens]
MFFMVRVISYTCNFHNVFYSQGFVFVDEAFAILSKGVQIGAPHVPAGHQSQRPKAVSFCLVQELGSIPGKH